MTTQQLTTGASENARLRVDFVWSVDRYVQTIVLVVDREKDSMSNNRERTILTSIDGNNAQVWPPSPPLQDLNFHELPTGLHAALAVGMAGTSHWSVSWEASQEQASLVCDVACRVKQSPGYLASTWQLADGLAWSELAFSDSKGADVHVSPYTVRVEATDNDPIAASCERIGDQICLSARPSDVALPTTIRWRYRLSV